MSLCYKDRTYCSSDCANVRCRRFMHKDLRKEAEDFGLPLCVADFSPDCIDYVKKE